MLTCPNDGYQEEVVDHDTTTPETRPIDRVIAEYSRAAGRPELGATSSKTVHSSPTGHMVLLRADDGQPVAVFVFERLLAGGFAIYQVVMCWQGPY